MTKYVYMAFIYSLIFLPLSFLIWHDMQHLQPGKFKEFDALTVVTFLGFAMTGLLVLITIEHGIKDALVVFGNFVIGIIVIKLCYSHWYYGLIAYCVIALIFITKKIIGNDEMSIMDKIITITLSPFMFPIVYIYGKWI